MKERKKEGEIAKGRRKRREWEVGMKVKSVEGRQDKRKGEADVERREGEEKGERKHIEEGKLVLKE